MVGVRVKGFRVVGVSSLGVVGDQGLKGSRGSRGSKCEV